MGKDNRLEIGLSKLHAYHTVLQSYIHIEVESQGEKMFVYMSYYLSQFHNSFFNHIGTRAYLYSYEGSCMVVNQMSIKKKHTQAP